MKKTRSILALLVITALVGIILAGCGGSAANNPSDNSAAISTVTEKTGTAAETAEAASTAAPAEKPQKVVMGLISFNKIPDDTAYINDALNKLTLPKANVEVDLQIFGPADFAQKISLALASGQQMDMFIPPMPETLGSMVAKNQLLPLEDLLPKYAKETMDILNKDFGEGLLKSTTINGHIYAVPANKEMNLKSTLVYNAGMLKEAGLTDNDITDINSLGKVFEAVKKKFPDVVPFGPVNTQPYADTGLLNLIIGSGEVDRLTDPSGIGVVVGNSGKVENLYATDLFKNNVKIVRDWYLKGYLQKDAATAATGFQELVTSKRGFSFIAGYSGDENGTTQGKQLSQQFKMNLASKKIAPFYFDTYATTFVTWAINANTEVPEGAVKFLNLTFSDKDVLNTILWGVEGQDYVKVDEHHAKYPDGKTADTVGYTAQFCWGLLGSESLMMFPEGTDYDGILTSLATNATAKRSPYFGFVFDPKDVKTEMGTISNVINQYLGALVTGSLDPDTTIPKFLKALDDAGAQTMIQKKQEQLDKWLSEQKK